MKIELKGWTVEDYDGRVEVYLPGGSNFVIGGGRVDSGTLARDVFNTLEDKFAKATGVTAWDVAAELERYLKADPDEVVVGEYKVKRCAYDEAVVEDTHNGRIYCLGRGPWHKDTPVIKAVRAKWHTGRTVAQVAEDVKSALEEKADIVVHGYTVAKDTTVTQPNGRTTEPVKYKEGYYDCGDKVINYVRRNTSTSATQADVVAKIKEYFEGPRDVKGHRLHRWKCGSQWFVLDSVSASLIGYGLTGWLGGRSAPPAFKAAQEKFQDGEPSLPEVADFIGNYREPVWHRFDLTCERDDKDNVVIPFGGHHHIRLSLVTGKSSVHKTAEEAKRCE